MGAGRERGPYTAMDTGWATGQDDPGIQPCTWSCTRSCTRLCTRPSMCRVHRRVQAVNTIHDRMCTHGRVHGRTRSLIQSVQSTLVWSTMDRRTVLEWTVHLSIHSNHAWSCMPLCRRPCTWTWRSTWLYVCMYHSGRGSSLLCTHTLRPL